MIKISLKKNLIIIYLLLLFIILFIIYKLFLYNKEDFDLQIWQNILKKNLSDSVATIMTIPPKEIRSDNCYGKCDERDCNMMETMKKNLSKCIECHKNPKKCFRKSIIGGNCDDCLPDEKQIDCKSTKELGCVPPHNVYSYDGSYPYFIQIPDKNLNSPYDRKCVFCWQIHEYI